MNPDLVESKAEEIHHFLSVFGGHEIRPGQNQIVLQDRAIFDVIRQKDDRQLTLKPLLLVDRELHLVFDEGLDNHG